VREGRVVIDTVTVPRRFLQDFLKALNFHGGHGTPSFDRAHAEGMKQEAEELLRTGGWISVKDRLPDDDLTVMIAMAESDEPWWLGYHSHDEWFSVDATQPASPVTHWKPMEAGPNG
jgi:hypothetical protein